MSDNESTNDARVTVLRAAIDEGAAELDAGLGVEVTVDNVMGEVRRECGLDLMSS